VTPFASTRTPPPRWRIRLTGAFFTTRLRPSSAAMRSQISPVPPTKRDSCAPPRVLKLRSKVPTFSSFPDPAM
jgi:hypothetical protein